MLRLDTEGWRLEAGGWRLKAGGWSGAVRCGAVRCGVVRCGVPRACVCVRMAVRLLVCVCAWGGGLWWGVV